MRVLCASKLASLASTGCTACVSHARWCTHTVLGLPLCLSPCPVQQTGAALPQAYTHCAIAVFSLWRAPRTARLSGRRRCRATSCSTAGADRCCWVVWPAVVWPAAGECTQSVPQQDLTPAAGCGRAGVAARGPRGAAGGRDRHAARRQRALQRERVLAAQHRARAAARRSPGGVRRRRSGRRPPRPSPGSWGRQQRSGQGRQRCRS